MKSEKIQLKLIEILSNLMDIHQSYSIITPSFHVKFFKVYATQSNMPREFSLQNNSLFNYSNSFANLLGNYLDQVIFVKVK